MWSLSFCAIIREFTVRFFNVKLTLSGDSRRARARCSAPRTAARTIATGRYRSLSCQSAGASPPPRPCRPAGGGTRAPRPPAAAPRVAGGRSAAGSAARRRSPPRCPPSGPTTRPRAGCRAPSHGPAAPRPPTPAAELAQRERAAGRRVVRRDVPAVQPAPVAPPGGHAATPPAWPPTAAWRGSPPHRRSVLAEGVEHVRVGRRGHPLLPAPGAEVGLRLERPQALRLARLAEQRQRVQGHGGGVGVGGSPGPAATPAGPSPSRRLATSSGGTSTGMPARRSQLSVQPRSNTVMGSGARHRPAGGGHDRLQVPPYGLLVRGPPAGRPARRPVSDVRPGCRRPAARPRPRAGPDAAHGSRPARRRGSRRARRPREAPTAAIPPGRPGPGDGVGSTPRRPPPPGPRPPGRGPASGGIARARRQPRPDGRQLGPSTPREQRLAPAHRPRGGRRSGRAGTAR